MLAAALAHVGGGSAVPYACGKCMKCGAVHVECPVGAGFGPVWAKKTAGAMAPAVVVGLVRVAVS